MFFRSSWVLPWVLVGSFVSVGCEGEPDCLESSHAIRPDDASPLGPTPREVVSRGTLRADAMMTWFTRKGFLVFEGRGTTTSLHFAISPAWDTARFVRSRENPRNRNENDKSCYDRIEVDAALELRTEDGWLDEAGLPIRVAARWVNDQEPTQIDWSTPGRGVPFDMLEGTLASGLSEAPGKHSFEVNGVLPFSGGYRLEVQTFTATASEHDGGDSTLGVTPLACVASEAQGCAEPE